MSIKYTFLSENEKLAGTALQVCNDENGKFSVLQYKAEGCLRYSHQRGMYSEDEKMQTERICEFLKMAQKQGSDLVIAPEASVPLAVVKKIICGEFIPEAGKLWCLGGEGIAKEDYKDLLEEWNQNDEIIFIHSEAINFGKYVNAMFYFFLAADGRLTMVLQAKIGGMRDIFFAHEQADLSTGTELFVVDLHGAKKAENVLVTLICADILNINAIEFCNTFHGKSPIVVNIQMNAKPFHGKIVEFRRSFFGDGLIRNGQLLAANWGRGTSIRQEGAVEPPRGHSDSGSVIYLSIEHNHGEDTLKEILTQPKFVEHIGETQQSGLEYFLTNTYELWKIQEDIQVASYFLKRGYRQNTKSNILEKRYLPYIVEKYRFNSGNRLEADTERKCDCLEVNEILQMMGSKRASRDIKKCAGQSCRECVRFYIDALVSLCLGEDVLEEYLVSDGKSRKASQTLYQDSKEKKKKENLGKLVKCLTEKKFPERFGEFRENDDFCFVVNYDAAKNGGDNKYNLELQRANRNPRRILVAFLGYMNLEDIRQKYIEIKASVHEERQADILLYYIDDNGRQVYSEPYEQTSISIHNNDFSQNIESFK